MKAIALLLLLPLCALAQESRLRLIGTNVVDFSAVYQAMNQPASAATEWHRRYVAEGTISPGENGKLLVSRKVVEMWFDTSAQPVYGFPRGPSAYETAAKIARTTQEQWVQLPEQVRRYFLAREVTYQWEARNVTNQPGEKVRLVGWPVSSSIIDCGVAYRVVGAARKTIVIGSSGLSIESIQSVNDANEAQRAAFLIQQKSAEEGSGSAQYELGKRYLRGLGTETNLAMATRWLSAARTNGYEQAAVQLLQSIGQPAR